MPVWFEYQTVNALQEKIDAIEKDAKEVKALQLEIDAMIDETRLLIAEKNAAPAVVDMLNTLSTLIKDDTWLILCAVLGRAFANTGRVARRFSIDRRFGRL